MSDASGGDPPGGDPPGGDPPGQPRLSPKKKEELVMRTLAHVPGCVRWVSNMWPGLLDEEEAETVAKISAMEIVAKYDEARDATYDAYAKRRIRGSLLDLVRAVSKDKQIERAVLRAVLITGAHTPVDYDQIKDSDDTLKARGRGFARRVAAVGFAAGVAAGITAYGKANAEDPLEVVEARKEYERAMEELRKAFEALTPDEQLVTEAVCCDGLDLRAVSKRFGIPEITVRRRWARGLAKLKEALAKAGIKQLPALRDGPELEPFLKSVLDKRRSEVVDLDARRRGKKK